MNRYLFWGALIVLLVSCNPHKKTEEVVVNRINRDSRIAFMGIRLGLPNDSVRTVLQSDENFVITDFPDIYTRSGHNTFDGLDENVVCAFFCSIVDTKNNKHGGWGKVKSDADSVTTIYYYIPVENEADSVYERLKPLFEERYGVPDKEYDSYKPYDTDVETSLYDRGCYWDFANGKRIYLNDVVYRGYKYGGIFSDALRVEIVYRDMRPVYRKEEVMKKKHQQATQVKKKAEVEQMEKNSKRRKEQQL